MPCCKRPLVALALSAAAVFLTGCAANETSYEVYDKFQIKNFAQLPKGTRPKAQFIEVIDPTDPSGKHEDIYLERDVWERCWVGDQFIVKKIGTDGCVRTSKSTPPKKG